MDDLIKSEKKSTAPLFRLSSWSDEIYGGYDTRLYYGEGSPACMPNIYRISPQWCPQEYLADTFSSRNINT